MALILLAEDNDDHLETMRMLLTAAGHDVTAMHDGVTALEQLRGRSFDVLIADLAMFGMSGYELIAQAGDRLPAKVIVTSGMDKVDWSRLPEGAVFLQKPYDSTALLAMVAPGATDETLVTPEKPKLLRAPIARPPTKVEE